MIKIKNKITFKKEQNRMKSVSSTIEARKSFLIQNQKI